MDAYLLDWANLLLRWVHVITAIAWIGSSFYFVFLDNNLIRPNSPDLLEKGVDGAMWAVHGGGFYNPQKYMVAPKKIHTTLHWFYWESYSTWLTGFALFTVLYLYNAGTFLIDKSLMDWSPAVAGATAVGNPARIIQAEQDALREEAASKMGFSAYGVTANDDPLSQAMRGLIDNAVAQEAQIAQLRAALERLGGHVAAQQADASSDVAKLNQLIGK